MRRVWLGRQKPLLPQHFAAARDLHHLLDHELEPGRRTERTDLDLYAPTRLRDSQDLGRLLGRGLVALIPSSQLATHLIPENSNTGIPLADRKKAIFPFSFGIWTIQVHGKGQAILGAVDNVSPTPATIADGSFPFGRFLYNVYCAVSGSGCAGTGDKNIATPATVNYIGEDSWICTTAANHGINPITGHNYATDIASTITANGFVPIPAGVVGNGYTNVDNCRLTVT
jgi:hypothetical protein